MPHPERLICHGSGRRGVTALEFALVAPVLLALFCGAIDAGWQLATEVALEHGAHDAARFAITGNSTISGRAGSPSCRADIIDWLIVSEAPAVLTTSNLQVLTTVDAGKTSESAGQSGFGGTASATVLYTLSYKQRFITPLGPILFGSPFIIHQVQLLVQNEAFPPPGC